MASSSLIATLNIGRSVKHFRHRLFLPSLLLTFRHQRNFYSLSIRNQHLEMADKRCFIDEISTWNKLITDASDSCCIGQITDCEQCLYTVLRSSSVLATKGFTMFFVFVRSEKLYFYSYWLWKEFPFFFFFFFRAFSKSSIKKTFIFIFL